MARKKAAKKKVAQGRHKAIHESKVRSRRKKRLSTEIDPVVVEDLRNFTAYLRASSYKISMAMLVEKFCSEGMDRLQKKHGLCERPKVRIREL